MHTLLVSRQVAGLSPVPPTFADLCRLPWREKGKSPKSALSALSQRDREFESISLRAENGFLRCRRRGLFRRFGRRIRGDQDWLGSCARRGQSLCWQVRRVHPWGTTKASIRP